MKLNRDIFEYLSARTFLEKLYLFRKNLRRRYSYPRFSKDLGLSASSHIYQFIKGNRELSEEAAETIATALELQKKPAKYFLFLVQFDRAELPGEKSLAFQNILDLRQDEVMEDLDEKTMAYLSKIHIPLIRELVDLPDFQPDPAWICERLGIELTKKEAMDAFAVLQKHDFIRFDPAKQKWVQTEFAITLPDGTQSSILCKIQSDLLELAKVSIWKDEPEDRNVGSMILTIDEKNYDGFCKDVQDFRFKMAEKYSDDKPTMIVGFASQLFKVTGKKK